MLRYRWTFLAAALLVAGCSSDAPSSPTDQDVDRDLGDDAADDPSDDDTGDDVAPADVGPADTELDGTDTDPPDTDPTDSGPEDADPDDVDPTDVDPADVDEDVPDTTPDAVDDTVEDTVPDTVADTGPDATDTGPDVPPVDLVTRFIIMGDTGEGNEEQYAVSAAAEARCDAAGGCDGFIMLGDNIYDTGAESEDDQLLTDYIDLPSANLRQGPPPADGEPDTRPRLPMYVTLGNHDLGGAGLNNEQIANYVGYGRNNDWFYYPSEYWDLTVGNVELMSVHTNPMAYLGTTVDQQGTMVTSALAATAAPWSIVFGHHPYRSNGPHGNAGSYEGIPGDLVFLGGAFKDWIHEYVCNDADFYFSGHDHSRQWLASVPLWGELFSEDQPCDTWFAVSGAGAKSSDIEDRDNDMAFAEATEGFLFGEFYADHVDFEYIDPLGNVDWSTRIDR